MHRYLLHNDEIRETSETNLAAGQVGLLAGWGVFSTLRVYDGVMFGWERHWERMQRDAARMRVPFPSEPGKLFDSLNRLIDANGALNSTLRVVAVRNQGGLYTGPGQTRDFDLIAFTVDCVNWPASMKLGLIPNGRHAASEFAGTKYTSWSENLMRYERAHEQGLDEVILFNERSEVAECTSANVFCVHGRKVSTPPLSSGCLPGVTRAILLDEIEIPDIDIRERVLLQADLESADEVLITSTTREILPVTYIEGLPGAGLARGGHGVCESLRAAFRKNVDAYVRGHSRSMLGRNIPAI
jgi:branched-chain amino acid aminotransferase